MDGKVFTTFSSNVSWLECRGDGARMNDGGSQGNTESIVRKREVQTDGDGQKITLRMSAIVQWKSRLH